MASNTHATFNEMWLSDLAKWIITPGKPALGELELAGRVFEERTGQKPTYGILRTYAGLDKYEDRS